MLAIAVTKSEAGPRRGRAAHLYLLSPFGWTIRWEPTLLSGQPAVQYHTKRGNPKTRRKFDEALIPKQKVKGTCQSGALTNSSCLSYAEGGERS
jgi:hypothetical protein